MAEQGESYPSGGDIRKQESQGEMMAREAEEKKGTEPSEVLRPGDEEEQRLTREQKKGKAA